MGEHSRILFGVRVDGVAIYAPVKMAPGEIVCPECEGQGTCLYDYGRDGFQNLRRETCETCDGAGVLTIETPEEE